MVEEERLGDFLQKRYAALEEPWYKVNSISALYLLVQIHCIVQATLCDGDTKSNCIITIMAYYGLFEHISCLTQQTYVVTLVLKMCIFTYWVLENYILFKIIYFFLDKFQSTFLTKVPFYVHSFIKIYGNAIKSFHICH